jgi:hypothetical protein
MSQLQDKPNAKDKDATLNVLTFRDHPLSQETDRGGDIRQAEDPADDTFLYYSDDEIRMRAISGGIVGAAQETAKPEVKRKSRLSFELHPSVFYDDLFSNELSQDETNKRITEEIVENMKKSHHPHMVALLSILLGEEDEIHPNVSTPRAA